MASRARLSQSAPIRKREGSGAPRSRAEQQRAQFDSHGHPGGSLPSLQNGSRRRASEYRGAHRFQHPLITYHYPKDLLWQAFAEDPFDAIRLYVNARASEHPTCLRSSTALQSNRALFGTRRSPEFLVFCAKSCADIRACNELRRTC